MRKLILAAGVAALAITAPASAKPDKGGGHGGHAQAQGGGGGGQKAERGGGQKAERRGGGGGQQAQRVERRGGGERRAAQKERRGGGPAQRMERRGGGERQAQRIERHGQERQAQRVDRRGAGERRFANFQSGNGRKGQQRVEKHSRGDRDFARVENRGRGGERHEIRNHEQRFASHDQFRGRNDARVRNFDDARQFAVRDSDEFRRVAEWRDWNDGDWDRRFANRGLPASFVGCPPGLAKKSPACVPPGLARNAFVGAALPNYYASNSFPVGLRDIYYDTDDYYYRWGDGYAYRVDRGDQLISALLPLVGAGLGVGMPFPYQGSSYYVPSSYQSFYPDYGYDDDYYRYANGYVYEIDGNSGYIEDVIPLLDRGYGVGQMLPAGYSYYNVPYQYRDAYYDTDDYSYRYAPGAIYQVDRDSQLITGIASLLTGGLSVGQPLPPAYGVYNVPMSYRDTYYDTPDNWYRYSNGYIYQVDPTTQLITAIVRSIV